MITQITSNISAIIWSLIGLAGLVTIFIVAFKQDKKRKIYKGQLTERNEILLNSRIYSYHLTDQFLFKHPILYLIGHTIKKELYFKEMIYCSRTDDVGVVLRHFDQYDYKFYHIFDVFPVKVGEGVKGYIRNDIFYITDTVD